MLDLAKEAKRLEDYIKNTMAQDDRQIEVDAYHAKEMLDRAIIAEANIELRDNAICNFHKRLDARAKKITELEKELEESQKAVELMAEHISMNEECHNCQFHDGQTERDADNGKTIGGKNARD